MVDEASGKFELARLVTIVPAAREPLLVRALWHERVEVHVVDADSNGAEAILGRPLDAPLE